ncbi:MAG TPA: cupin domain-containing protein [Candidatus Binatia bacterium]|jgi:quercetin dioxygenase-like cupin family protein|nr:cupin domain-containing protein [Candidatus Binatia bacterium]
MAIYTVNENDVEMAKSGRGYTKWLHVGKHGASPEMMIRHWGPDTDIPVHSHPFHEMFYVLEGEIEIGGTVYNAGSCIYIEKDTPYGPTRAPKGGKVLRYAEARPGK